MNPNARLKKLLDIDGGEALALALADSDIDPDSQVFDALNDVSKGEPIDVIRMNFGGGASAYDEAITAVLPALKKSIDSIIAADA